MKHDGTSSGEAGAAGLHEAHAHALACRLGLPLIGGNGVRWVSGREAAALTLCELADMASDHINVCAATVGGDASREMVARLGSRQQAGVQVNLLRPAWLGTRLPLRCAPARLMVFDGRIACLGIDGADDRVGLFVVEGPIVRHLQRRFIARWQRHERAPLPTARYFPPLFAAGTQVAVDVNAAGAESALAAAIGEARLRVTVAATGCRLPDAVRRELADATARGVVVTSTSGNGSPCIQAAVDGLWCSSFAPSSWLRRCLDMALPTLIVLDEHVAGRMERQLADAPREDRQARRAARHAWQRDWQQSASDPLV